MNKFKVLRLDPSAKLPTRGHDTDCGLDIYSLENAIVPPGGGVTLSTGISAIFETGNLGMMADRSSMAKKGWKVSGGIIDPGYTGELKVVLRNISHELLNVDVGDRIAQLLIVPILTPEVEEVFTLPKSKRGNNGFGSTGK